MRILVVHNRYRSSAPSGENKVVDDDVARLCAAGVEVERYERSSDDIADMSLPAKLAVGVRPVHSFADTRALGGVIDRFRPDVVHLHNPFPMISPSVIRTARRRGVAVVQTVHNYRATCIAGTHYRDERICTACCGRSPLPGIRHGCYQGSRVRSVPLAVSSVVHRSTWRAVDRFLAVSPFVARWLVEHDVAPADRVDVRWNSIVDPGPPVLPGSGALFTGRIERQKGALALVRALRRTDLDLRLTIAGDGPDRAQLEREVGGDPRIDLIGLVDADRVQRELRRAAFAVVPSLWNEPATLSATEALAHGRAVLATRIGGLVDVVGEATGWVVDPTVDGLEAGLRAAAATTAEDLASRGVAARERYERRHHPDRAVERLVELYGEVSGAS
ncbi:MAG: glycosyltransferase family 4 protein [Actinomycetota bacterium]